ncbi:MAG TPA: GNAT family N-acetyltransferase, partial [bacterium]|nr:GNAT family N-acetyltransferase [bacterium]
IRLVERVLDTRLVEKRSTQFQKIQLRPVGRKDESFLRKVFAASRDAEMEHSGWTAEQKKSFVKAQSKLQREDYVRRHPGADFCVIECNKTPVGVFHMDRAPEHLWLMDIAVLKGYRDMGIERRLVERLLTEATRAQKPVRLNIEKSNPYLALFREMGFVQVEDQGFRIQLEWVPRSRVAVRAL